MRNPLIAAAGLCLLAALASSASAASSHSRAIRATKAFHATKDCAGFTGLVGAFCTIRSSNVKAITPGSKIFYFQQASKAALDSDMAVYVARGTVATGHCLLHFKTGVGLCTVSDGTGGLAARLVRTADVGYTGHWNLRLIGGSHGTGVLTHSPSQSVCRSLPIRVGRRMVRPV